jgi:LuxR family transcriptional regulator, maltose regulon positive regulatory protein
LLNNDERLALAKLLAEYYSMRHDAQAIRRLMLIAAPWLEDAHPLARGFWWLTHARNELQFGTAALAETSAEQARGIAETHQLATLQMVLAEQSLRAALLVGDLDHAARLLQHMRPLALRLKPGHHRPAMQLEAMDALLRGESKRACDLLDLLLKVCDDVEVPQRDRGVYHVYRAYARLELDDLPGALQALAQAGAGQSGAQQQMVGCLEQFLRAGYALVHNEPGAVQHVRSALGMAAAMQYPMFLPAQPALASKLAQVALDAGIETDFVVAAVRKRRLAPPDPWREDWPWALKLKAVGNFVIEREGRVVNFDGKAQKKPLELLKVLIALGGEALPREVLALALWPAADADAVKNFDVTLSRLRKLLEIEGAITLADGKVSLNRRLVWWDVAAFEAHCAALHTALHTTRHATADDDTVTALAAEVFRLHRDKLFGDEPAAAWSVAARERLAVKFNRAVGDVGTWLEARGAFREAIDRYERGLAHQMLAEPLYRGLMRCHLALHEPAEALVAYRRCRDMLSILLSVKPSEQTEALHQRIRAA